MAALWASYKAWADETEQVLLLWGDPRGVYKLSPMQHYPLASFAECFALCVGYLLFVVFGSLIMKSKRVPAMDTSMLQFTSELSKVVAGSYVVVCLGVHYVRLRGLELPSQFDMSSGLHFIMGNSFYALYLYKLLEWRDTLFIVMGKKWDQLSLVHVWSRISFVFGACVLLKFF